MKLPANKKAKYPFTADLCAYIMDFRGFDSSIIFIVRGGIPRSIGELSGKCDSSNLSRDSVSRSIGPRLSRCPSLRASASGFLVGPCSGPRAEKIIVIYNKNNNA